MRSEIAPLNNVPPIDPMIMAVPIGQPVLAGGSPKLRCSKVGAQAPAP